MFLKQLKENFKHANIRTCNEKGCKIKIGVKDFFILKGESMIKEKHKKMCDCIVFQNNRKILLIELKNKTIDANAIVEKLSNGAEISISKLSDFGHDDFIPYFILVAKGYPRTELNKLRYKKIIIDGKKYNIILGECGDFASNLIEKHERLRSIR